MQGNRWRGTVAIVALLTVLSGGSACSGRVSDPEPDGPPPSATPTIPATASELPEPEPPEPEVPEMEAALPAGPELGPFAEYDSCFSSREECSSLDGGVAVDVSWVRGSTGMGGSPSYDWAQVEVASDQARGHVRRVRREARRECPLRFVVPAEPRGFFPRPRALDGRARRERVEASGFRGTHCARRLEDRQWGAHHEILVARGDVRLEVSARTRKLVFRLLREYVARLG